MNEDITELYAPVGCSECSDGYRGRIAIHEVLVINQEIRDAIAEDRFEEYRRENVEKLAKRL